MRVSSGVKKGLAALAMLLTLSAAAVADGFPAKPVRFIVPNPPGGASDIVARLFSDKLAQSWGQPVLVENRPGASTVIGTDAVAKAPADGYSILVMTLTHPLNAAFKKKMPYDSAKDFTGITLVARSPMVLVVNPALPIKSVPELIAYAKSNPGKLSYASAGSGTAQHMAAEMLKSMAGIDMLHVPFKGSTAAYPDLIGGQVALMFDTIPAIQAHIRSGAVRALAVAGSARSTLLPDLPTVAETVPGFDAGSWVGLLVRAGTPPAIVEKLSSDVIALTTRPEVRERFSELGLEPVGSTPSDFNAFMTSEFRRWSALIDRANIRAD